MTKNKLWQASDGDALDPVVEKYTVGDDQTLDQLLLGHDITATKAHAHMLEKIGILNADEYEQLAAKLDELYALWQDGSFVVTSEYEDGHTAIETYLTAELGDIGKKVHTGRSRNDQALVMMRLYVKDNMQTIQEATKQLIDAYEKKTKEVGDQPMPGYTHTQKAMPASVAMWLGSYHDAFNDALPYLKDTTNYLDQNPLGSAAGFGVGLPLDRDMTTKELGFKTVQENPMYCGLSRGVFELAAVQALSLLMVYAGKFADDMLRFTSQEYDFFSLPRTMTTGSSIMPHKRNYDVFEIMRANAHEFGLHAGKLQAIAGGVGSGYHRDLQLTKGITIKALETAKSTIEVLTLCINNLSLKKEKLDAAMTEELETVAAINKLVEQGVPFRDAYQQVKKSLS